ncbi:MAG: GHKL domain-containing protein, partial [Calditrichaeota bacterium]|nr:GHKL domain-containing protein [Calditrichota bacterium]
LDGFDSDWISINTAEQRQYTYTNLPYGGPYYFTIQARSADGEWSEPVRSGAIRLDYPFYLTWWFLAVVILMIALLGYWINGYFNQSRINVLLQQKIDEKMAEVEEANQRVLIQNRQLKQEISERKRIEEERELFVRELENKNKELERYTYTISHDLKSPIITIKGYLGLLSDYAKQSDLENIVANIPVIAKAADTMFQLLDDLISITKIEKTEQQLSEFAMYDVLDETKELLASRLKEEEVEITVSSELPVIIADKKRLIEVMKNLLDNAIKYRNKNKRLKISITCLENGQHHLFAVSDNGLGIDMKYKDKIFGIFERLNQAIDGTGIGLAIVKSIIESHKGSVWVESDGPGKGSTFYFTIPRSV